MNIIFIKLFKRKGLEDKGLGFHLGNSSGNLICSSVARYVSYTIVAYVNLLVAGNYLLAIKEMPSSYRTEFLFRDKF